MSARQGSASFTIVIAGLTALVVGAMLLTFVLYPYMNAFVGSGFWNADTTAGLRVIRFTEGLWRFWGGIVLMAILSFIWVQTRQ